MWRPSIFGAPGHVHKVHMGNPALNCPLRLTLDYHDSWATDKEPVPTRTISPSCTEKG